MDKTEEIMKRIEGKKTADAVSLLNNAIDDMLDMPYESVDTDFIDNCADIIARLLNIPFKPEGKTAAVEKIREIFDRYEKLKKDKRACSIKRRLKTALKIAAIAAALIFMLGCAVYAVNKDAFYLIIEKIGYSSYKDMPRGNHGSDEITVKKYLKEYKYDSINEAAAETDIPLIYPEKLPDGYTVSCIYFTVFEDERKLTFDITPCGFITVDASDRYKAPDADISKMEKLTFEGKDFYVSDLGVYWQALFNAGDYQYMITAGSREDLELVLYGMKEVNRNK